MEALPNEILDHLLRYFYSFEDLLSLRACNKEMKRIMESDFFWRSIVVAKEPDLVSENDDRSYFQRFSCRKQACKKMREAWEHIERFMNSTMIQSLKRGATCIHQTM
jgi:hypothetical protein